MSYAHASVEIDGARLRQMRKEAGLHLVQLAEKVGVSFGYLSAIERGAKRTVSPARYITICDALDLQDRTALYAAKPVAA